MSLLGLRTNTLFFKNLFLNLNVEAEKSQTGTVLRPGIHLEHLILQTVFGGDNLLLSCKIMPDVRGTSPDLLHARFVL